MRSTFSTTLVLLAAGTTVAASAAGEKHTLILKAKPGQLVRYRTTVNLTLEANGQKALMEIKETEKVTFAGVAPNGDITTERETESSEMSINGTKLPPSTDPPEKATVVFRSNNSLVSYKSGTPDGDSDKLSVRMITATNPIFPAQPVGPGDKWTHEFKADSATGARAGKGEFEVLSFEKSPNGVDAVKIRMAYRETEGNPAIASKGTYWVERSSGDQVVSDIELENVPFGPPGSNALASGKVKQERTEGSALGDAGSASAAPRPKTIDDVVKGYTKEEGLLTLYRKKDNNRETLYLEIREEQLNQLMMLQATAATGTGEAIIAGDPLADIVFRWEKLGEDKLVMVVPNIAFRADPQAPIARAVKRSFPDAYLQDFKIEARQPERTSLLINITDYFRNDIAQLGQALTTGGLIGMGVVPGVSYALDREKTLLQSVKSFPENFCVETSYHFLRGGPPAAVFGRSTTLADPRSVPLRVQFNLFPLKNNGYQPRLADPRVGYFYTEFQDFTDDGRDTQMTRYIYRWNVEKADPKAPLSSPKKPITFWLDNAIPTEYRAAVRDGLLMWNAAFAKIGIRDAIVVKQMPDDAEWDHADMRYNVIRWSTTQTPPYGAIALFRVNPLTGEILNAGITVDATLTRGTKFERRRIVEPSTRFEQLERDPQSNALSTRACRCELAEGAMEQAWFGFTALELLAAPGTKVDEKAYTESYLRSIVAHEMGHILGLFHNFAASTELSLEELKDPKKVKDRGTVASVMDYYPFNIAALRSRDVEYWPTKVGAYDLWAVRYGYSPTPAEKPEADRSRLKEIASQGNLPGRAFHNDILADGFDPAVSRFDLSKEPLEYHDRLMRVSRHLLMTLDQREPKKGESYWEFTRLFNGLLNQYASGAAQATRYIGGLHMNRNHRGDAGEKPTLVPVAAEKQKRALKLLNDYVLAERAFNFPKSYYARFTNNPFPDARSFASGGGPDFPVLDSIANMQRAALRRLYTTAVLNRVANNEYKTAESPNTFTLAELFGTVGTTVWSELEGGKEIDTLRRRLQRAHLEEMVRLANTGSGAPEDARMLAWDQLRRLKSRITSARRRKPGQYTQVHLDESLVRINRALNATQTLSN